jgi:hypothetical protein
MKTIFLLTTALLIFMVTSQPAHAYLDPGTGSFLFQLLVGGILSGLFAIKIYYKKIKGWFKKQPEQNIEKPNNETHETTE